MNDWSSVWSSVLVGFGTYIALVAAILGVWWIKCGIQDRRHARETVRHFDAAVATSRQRLEAAIREANK